jgi:hypothetical protein
MIIARCAGGGDDKDNDNDCQSGDGGRMHCQRTTSKGGRGTDGDDDNNKDCA